MSIHQRIELMVWESWGGVPLEVSFRMKPQSVFLWQKFSEGEEELQEARL